MGATAIPVISGSAISALHAGWQCGEWLAWTLEAFDAPMRG